MLAGARHEFAAAEEYIRVKRNAVSGRLLD